MPYVVTIYVFKISNGVRFIAKPHYFIKLLYHYRKTKTIDTIFSFVLVSLTNYNLSYPGLIKFYCQYIMCVNCVHLKDTIYLLFYFYETNYTKANSVSNKENIIIEY